MIDGKVRPGSDRALGEQFYRCALRKDGDSIFSFRWPTLQVGQREWRHGEDVFSLQVQDGSAGGEDFQRGTILEPFGDQAGGRKDLLEVVQQQKQPLLAEILL